MDQDREIDGIGPDGEPERTGDHTLKFTKLSEDQYLVTAAPPEVREAWTTSEQLSYPRLLKELLLKGAHPVDVADALNEVDPEEFDKRHRQHK
jgi:hypothetical protein